MWSTASAQEIWSPGAAQERWGPGLRSRIGGRARAPWPGPGLPPAVLAADPPDRLDHAADGHGESQADQQAGPGTTLERLAADPPEQERVAGPQNPGHGGAEHEAAPRVADETTGEGDGSPAARDEPAGHDDPDAVPGQGPLGPVPAVLPSLTRENPSAYGRAESPAHQVGGIVAEERPERGERDQHRDPRIGAARRRDTEGDHRGFAGQHRDQRVERGHEDRDEIRDRGADIQLGQVDHQRPPRRRELSSRTSTTASAAPKMIHGAITIRSLLVT